MGVKICGVFAKACQGGGGGVYLSKAQKRPPPGLKDITRRLQGTPDESLGLLAYSLYTPQWTLTKSIGPE